MLNDDNFLAAITKITHRTAGYLLNKMEAKLTTSHLRIKNG
jgi:hypothetical protein